MRSTSYWETKKLEEKTQVLIIGGGLSGLSTGIHILLQNSDCKVTILEKDILSKTASTKNAGFACFGSPSEILSDLDIMGFEETQKMIKMRANGIQLWQDWFSASEIDFSLCGGFEVFNEQQEGIYARCIDRLQEINELCSPVVSQVFSEVEFQQFKSFKKGFKNSYEGALNPMKLVNACQNKFRSLGGELLEGIEVSEIHEKAVSFIWNEQQIYKSTDWIVLTNNAFGQHWAKELDVKTSEIYPARAQVLVTEPLDVNWKGTFHVDEGYYYFRNLENRILIGGGRNEAVEEETTFNQATTPFIQNKIEEVLFNDILGKTCIIDYRWAGTMAMGPEKKPIIKHINNHTIAAVRLSGMGVALSAEIGKLLSTHIIIE